MSSSKVLLIEEDIEVTKTITEWLHDIATITRVSEKAEIIQMIGTQTWDLIITDSLLPTLDDLDITNLVKSTDPFTPVFIVTQHQKINFVLEALQNHADGLQFKPLEKEKFLALALKLIESSQAQRKKKSAVVLAIGAHPDDVEIGCGGSLVLHHASKDIIHILTLSSGESGGNPLIRREEGFKAAELLNAHLHCRDLPDTKISEGIETIKEIEQVVAMINPTYIYTHSLHDTHRDHRNVFHATISSCRSIPNLYCYQSPSSSVDFKPNLFIELLTEYLEKKLEAIACYESQCRIRPYLQEDMLRATARYWGRFCNYGLAEPMEVIRQNKM